VHPDDVNSVRKAFEFSLKAEKNKVKTVEYLFKLDHSGGSGSTTNTNYIKIESVFYALNNPFNGHFEYIVCQSRICPQPLFKQRAVSATVPMSAANSFSTTTPTTQMSPIQQMNNINQYNYYPQQQQQIQTLNQQLHQQQQQKTTVINIQGGSGAAPSHSMPHHISMPMTPSPEEFSYNNNNSDSNNTMNPEINIYNPKNQQQQQLFTTQSSINEGQGFAAQIYQGNINPMIVNVEPNQIQQQQQFAKGSQDPKLVRHLHAYNPYPRVDLATTTSNNTSPKQHSPSSTQSQQQQLSSNSNPTQMQNLFHLSDSYCNEIKNESFIMKKFTGPGPPPPPPPLLSPQQQQQHQINQNNQMLSHNYANTNMNQYNLNHIQQQHRHQQYISNNNTSEETASANLWHQLLGTKPSNNNNNSSNSNNSNSNTSNNNLSPK
jgi:hypothetical protein